ncbi:SRPBCC family protein [Pseudochryseolinea flava]|uniref:Activator of HSP90 ATPase n=1 Tax=Pseudochryseolinea flava TaxID=2059302 RepID=A0A364Y3L6_9BACT|nr:SRPBCC family protein [Pseudochryseolinea flava]RAW00746.1 activator of HSP90 ATPase [Pseudochryseolinea flava]
MESQRISVSATIHADKKTIWNYYTDPVHIVHWNFADPSWHCPAATNDIQVGGKFSARMEAKDGSFGFTFEGVYIEVEKSERLVYTMTDGRKATITFTGSHLDTTITITFDAELENPVDMQRDGWQAILNNFKTYVEANRSAI